MGNLQSLSLVESHLQARFIAGLQGDAHAYRVFLRDLRQNLRVYLKCRLSPANNEIEDILQEVLLAIHTARHSYRSDQPLTAWAYAIARYKLVDFFRASVRRAPFSFPMDPDDDKCPSADNEAASAGRDIGSLLRALPDRYRLPILHMKVHGFSVTETARLTGLSESAVKIGVHRGIKKLISSVNRDRPDTLS